MKYIRVNPDYSKEYLEEHPHLKHVTRCWYTTDRVYYIQYDEVNKYKHLRISRTDGEPLHNYMHLQEIKNDLLGEDVIAVEVYPKKSDFKDGSNTYHIWTWEGLEAPNLLELYNYID